MSTLLKIQSSLFQDDGQSSILARRFVENWLSAHKDGRLVSRDLAADNLPHLDQNNFQALITEAEKRTPAQQDVAAYADQLIEELQAADVLVLGVPMYNFGIPSVLKAWFDYIARAGVTFRYTDQGPEGLLKGKKAYVFITRGGFYGGDEHSQSALVREFLGFVGITDVEIVYAEGLQIDEDTRNKSLTEAGDKITKLLAA